MKRSDFAVYKDDGSLATRAMRLGVARASAAPTAESSPCKLRCVSLNAYGYARYVGLSELALVGISWSFLAA